MDVKYRSRKKYHRTETPYFQIFLLVFLLVLKFKIKENISFVSYSKNSRLFTFTDKCMDIKSNKIQKGKQ